MRATARPIKSLTDFGWLVEPADHGGVRFRRSSQWRASMVGCTTVIFVLFAAVGAVVLFMGKGFLLGPPAQGPGRIPILLLRLTIVGGFACFLASLVWRVLRFAFHREEWEATPNRLIVWRGVVGFLRSRELSGCELLIEPHYKRNQSGQHWRLAAVNNDEKHYLLREQEVPIGFRSTADLQLEADAIASLLKSHTGWNVLQSEICVEGQPKPPTDSNEEELLTTLSVHGFVAEVDAQWRLTIRPPKQRMGGLALLAVGIGWLWLMADAEAMQQIAFWILMTPMLMIGFGLCAIGMAIFFNCEHWTVDRNLLLIRSWPFGRKSEHEFVNARLELAQNVRTSSKGRSYIVWQLELENVSSPLRKVLRVDRDDDIPRLLGTLLSRRTGWPMRTRSK